MSEWRSDVRVAVLCQSGNMMSEWRPDMILIVVHLSGILTTKSQSDNVRNKFVYTK